MITVVKSTVHLEDGGEGGRRMDVGTKSKSKKRSLKSNETTDEQSKNPARARKLA
jgi:hypothetical protein